VLDFDDGLHQKAALREPEYQLLPILSRHLAMPRLRGLAAQLSDAKRKARDVIESKIQAALVVVRSCGRKLSGAPKYPLRQAAEDFEVPRSTLTDRYNGRLTHRQAAVKQQRLPPVQENLIAEWAKVCGRRGIPLGPQQLVESAEAVSGLELGESWVSGFRGRFPDIKPFWSSTFEAPRAQALNRPSVSKFYALYLSLISEFNVKYWNIYNMDEKGVMMGRGGRRYVLVDRNQSTVTHVENGNRQNVTIIECICADGTSITPRIIFKGKTLDGEWARDNPLNARYVALQMLYCRFLTYKQYLVFAEGMD
jgi:hypothetical protein